MELTANFQSSSTLCPIISQTLVDGVNEFDFEHFGFSQQTAQFTIGLKDSFISIQDTYSYTIRAVAEGGAF